jgi:glycosyltransferase involved in cell wall biosynthesis
MMAGISRPIILTVGRLRSEKAHDTSIRAMAELQEGTLVVIGDGPLEEELRALARRLGIARHVQFLGSRPDVGDWLAISDVYIQSSSSEAFGIGVVEAMLAGVPVVSSDADGLSETTADAALSFPCGDHHALGMAIRRILSDGELKGQHIKRGKSRGAQFSVDRCVSGYVKIYRHMRGTHERNANGRRSRLVD